MYYVCCFQYVKVTKMKANHNVIFHGLFINPLFPIRQSY